MLRRMLAVVNVVGCLVRVYGYLEAVASDRGDPGEAGLR